MCVDIHIVVFPWTPLVIASNRLTHVPLELVAEILGDIALQADACPR